MSHNILVIGAAGQIGTELVDALRKKHGNNRVIAADVRPNEASSVEKPYEQLDILNADRLREVCLQYKVAEVYHLAALLSATAEKNPQYAWKLNMDGLFHVLDLAREGVIKKVFWPSSIAVFGPDTPQSNVPQRTVLEPKTVYGISKAAGESWCEYYHLKYGVDVRSIRYPGLIGYNSPPGGGTTDYAVHIFYEALQKGSYTCFLREDRALPMMFMPDAIRATLELMEAPPERVKLRTGYNLSGLSFTPAQLADVIRVHVPNFSIRYEPDFRDAIAAGWPHSIDGSVAEADWGWKPAYTVEDMVAEMLDKIPVTTR